MKNLRNDLINSSSFFSVFFLSSALQSKLCSLLKTKMPLTRVCLVCGEGISCADPIRRGPKPINDVRFTHYHFCFPHPARASSADLLQTKMPAIAGHLFVCGEGGIRTLGTSLSSYNGLANRPFRPLRHLS